MAKKPPSIMSKTARENLVPRREPYWARITKGGFVGYRKARHGGTWVARLRTPDGRQHWQPLDIEGIAPPDQFDEARKRAERWFKDLGSIPSIGYTVADAIRDYTEHRTINNSPASGLEAKQRLGKHVVPKLGKVTLTRLTKKQITDWRNSLVRVSDDEEDMRRSKDGANRLLSYFKACLNLAYHNGTIGTDEAWRAVKAYQDVGQARKVFLNDDQIQRLRKATDGTSFGDLIESGLLCGGRYGELIAARVEDLDVRHASIRLDGKTGARDCYLSDAALVHFRRLVKGKLPGALLHIKEDGTPWGKSHQMRPMKEAVRKARLPRDTTFYALRHTHISRALLAGISMQVLAENCGTSIRMIETNYAKFARADRVTMMNLVEFG